MTHFQVPDDRVLQNPGSKIPSPWPANAAGYRLVVSGAAGKEKICVYLGQKIELDLVGGKGLSLQTKESRLVRNMPREVSGEALVAFANALPVLITVSELVATTDKQKFVVHATTAGSTVLYA